MAHATARRSVAVFFLLLEYIEFGGIYFYTVMAKQHPSPIPGFTFIVVALTCVTLPLCLLQWYMARREERNENDDSKRLLREAISRYNPATMIADEPEVAAKPFPRYWIWIIGLYAAAIVVLWCVGVLFI